MLHKTACVCGSVLVSVCVSASDSMCRNLFSPHRIHGAMQIHVHVDVALHRKFYFEHMTQNCVNAFHRPLSPIRKAHRPSSADPPPPLFEAVKGGLNLKLNYCCLNLFCCLPQQHHSEAATPTLRLLRPQQLKP